MPAAAEQADRVVAEADERVARPADGPSPDEAEAPVDEPHGGLADETVELRRGQPGREAGGRDDEDGEPDDRNRLQERVLLLLERQERERHDRKAEQRELVPDADH